MACLGTGLAGSADTPNNGDPSVGITMANRGSKYAGEDMPGREVGVGDLDVELLRLASLGGGESRSAPEST